MAVGTTASSVARTTVKGGKEPYVLLVPHSGVELDLAARNACAIITGAGGKLAHLVTVSRERDIPIVRVENAMEVVPKGHDIYLELDNGRMSFGCFQHNTDSLTPPL